MIDYWFGGEGRIRTSIQLFSNIICDETVNLDYSYERITTQPTLPICILPHLLILGAPSPTVRTLCGVITLLTKYLWTRRESNSPLSPCKGETPAIGTCEPKKTQRKIERYFLLRDSNPYAQWASVFKTNVYTIFTK